MLSPIYSRGSPLNYIPIINFLIRNFDDITIKRMGVPIRIYNANRVTFPL